MIRREAASRLALLAVALIGSGLLVEGVLRLYANVADDGLAAALREDPYAIIVEPHGRVGYRPRPNHTFGYANGSEVHINAMGFRGPVVPVPKPPGTFRVVLLGGSSTFGWGVNDSETIDSYMRAILSVRHPDRAIDVVNLAFDGYDSYQILERLQSDALRLQPDVVIVNTGVNDVRNAWFTDLRDGDPRTLLYRATMELARLERRQGGPTWRSRIKHWFYAARVPGWLRQQLGVGAAQAAVGGEPAPTFHWDALDYFERNVSLLLRTCARSGAAVLLATPPSSLLTMYAPSEPPRASYWIRDARTTQVYRDSLAARLRAIAGEAAERGEPARYVPRQELAVDLFLDDVHLTPEGNRSVAEHFVAALEPWLR